MKITTILRPEKHKSPRPADTRGFPASAEMALAYMRRSRPAMPITWIMITARLGNPNLQSMRTSEFISVEDCDDDSVAIIRIDSPKVFVPVDTG